MKRRTHVYLVSRELYSLRVTNPTAGRSGISEVLIGTFPLAAFSGTDGGLRKATAFAVELNRDNAERVGGTPKEHLSSSENRYWVDYGDVAHNEFQVLVVRSVVKKG